MKKIINQKRYDTETAKELASDSYSNPSDFNYWCETLYQKRTGEFFLYGEGGANSKYAESRGQNYWGGGEQIIPLSFESAQSWVEQHADADTYEKIFGEISEDSEKKIIGLTLSVSMIEKLRLEAGKHDCTMSELVEQLIAKA